MCVCVCVCVCMALCIGDWAIAPPQWELGNATLGNNSCVVGTGQLVLAAKSNMCKDGQFVDSWRMLCMHFPIYNSYSY